MHRVTVRDMEEQSTARTAAATAAAMWRAQERRADYLRERGWQCIPPDGQARLTAIVRPVIGAPGPAPQLRIAIVGPRAAGGRPRANLDGAGEREVGALVVDGQLPGRPEHIAQLAGLTEALTSTGYTPDGAWTVGVDPHGRYASVQVKRGRGV